MATYQNKIHHNFCRNVRFSPNLKQVNMVKAYNSSHYQNDNNNDNKLNKLNVNPFNDTFLLNPETAARQECWPIAWPAFVVGMP